MEGPTPHTMARYSPGAFRAWVWLAAGLEVEVLGEGHPHSPAAPPAEAPDAGWGLDSLISLAPW
jgi:hypothetical protein